MSRTSQRDQYRLSKEELRQLCKLSVPKGLFAIGFQWMVIIGSIWTALTLNLWWVTLLAVIVIGTRQHALAVLMHDASHYIILRNKLVNDVIASCFLSFPILASTTRYRTHHGLHHRHVNTDRDPDNNNRERFKSRWHMFVTAVKDVTAYNTMTTVGTLSHFGITGPMVKPADSVDGVSLLEKRLAWSFYGVVAFSLLAFGVWQEFLLFWALPMVTVLPPILRFRALAEHGGCEDESDLTMARTVTPGWIERVLLAPCNVHYHLEHHLYPGIPFYNLPKASDLLHQREVYAEQAHVNDGYFVGARRVVDEVVG
ncbi:fatty acid desaturase family protein [Roseobacter weihaiensis]|uniref:fatty acid desaturase family protein n=1 Tax=Roseobacter weihaiensis TaxID=2763262 RepID=UPI001D0A9B6A|nr:fatty acid desaturase family protein [Roseobacter sp. H9]